MAEDGKRSRKTDVYALGMVSGLLEAHVSVFVDTWSILDNAGKYTICDLGINKLKTS
jgi:hypothetical protein